MQGAVEQAQQLSIQQPFLLVHVQCANQPTYCILLNKQDKQMHVLHKGTVKARIISAGGSLGEETPVKDLLTQLGLSSTQVGHWKQCFTVLSVQGGAVIEQGTLNNWVTGQKQLQKQKP